MDLYFIVGGCLLAYVVLLALDFHFPSGLRQ